MIFPKKYKATFLFLSTLLTSTACVSITNANKSTSHRDTSTVKTHSDEYQHSNHNASWLAGSWGVTQRIDGGYRLNQSAGSSNWQSGAKEIVKKLPSVGHVITSFTHPAHAYLFTLRNNPNVDVASIHQNMVPKLKNEKIIFDVINIYRKAGKKVILYLNAAGPSMIKNGSRDDAIKKAWINYYKTEWNGDEGAAWRNLVEGYAKRFDGLVDGYWLDNVTKLPGSLPAFVNMLRKVDPTLSIAVNKSKAYFQDKNGDYLYVDSDGLHDQDKRDYKIVKHVPLNTYGDFTAGHITPLGRGAPPNSWGYEEYTLPDMAKSPWATYDGSHYTLKHAWFPVRERWSVARKKLIAEVEQAYRFVRTITDNRAAMTWSTTQTDGYMTADEMAIMKEINNRMTQKPKPPFKAYKRPKGAHLVSESK